MKVCIRHVNDTLLLVKDVVIGLILKELNDYHRYLKFNVNLFINKEVHFLDIQNSQK